jgi:hypothetical protein
MCEFGNWYVYDPIQLPSLVAFPYWLGKEPITAGQTMSVSIYAGVLYGTVRRTAINWPCDAPDPDEYGYWPGSVVDPIDWAASNITPGSGTVSMDGPFFQYAASGGIYTLNNLVASSSGAIFFTITGANTDTTYPLWNDSTVLELPVLVLPEMRLGYWRFNYTNWRGEEGQVPTTATPNLEHVSDWNYGALKINPPNPSAPLLQYPAYQTDGAPNVVRRQGTIRFWYKPSWSGSPAATATLFQMQDASQAPEWSLDIAPGTGAISLTVGSKTHELGSSLTWTAGQWYQIVVTYSPTENITKLYVNDEAVTGDLIGIDGFQGALGSFTIGNSGTGSQPAAGMYDELETFNYVLPVEAIHDNYVAALALDSDGDNISNFTELAQATNPYSPDSDGDGVNDHDDAYPGDPYRWDPDALGDTTSPIIQLLEPVTAAPVIP